MNKKLLILTVVIVAFFGAIYWFYPIKPRPVVGKYDEFAKCLALSGATMYGVYWCSHCQNEKESFGSSFQYVPYVECTQDPNLCLEKGVRTYPTWIFKDGRKFTGEQSLLKLSEISDCKLPSQY